MSVKHGKTRMHGMRTESAMGIDNGVPFGTAFTYTTSETYCAHCKRWIETNGVLGPLRFMAFHRYGDCQKHEIPPVLQPPTEKRA